MKFLLTLFAIALFSIAETQAEDVIDDNLSRPEDFDCSNLEDGKYQDPNRCSSYIVCEKKKAIVTDCGECSDRSECPEGRLHFNINAGMCDTPERANCKPPPSLPTPTPTTKGTTTPRTHPPHTYSTTIRGPTTPRPEKECPHNCTQKGYCNWYLDCQADGNWKWDDDSQMYWGKWENRTCGENLLWNPTPGVHPGGHCDYFENLPEDVQDEYKKDQDCFCPCYWDRADTDAEICAGKYLYWNREKPHYHNLFATLIQCPSHSNGTQLLYNEVTKTCDHCKNVGAATQALCGGC